MLYLVTYDRIPAESYSSLYAAIGRYPNRHAMQNAWFISTHETVEDVVRNLKLALNENDKLFVSEVTYNSALVGISWQDRTWIEARLGGVGRGIGLRGLLQI